MSPFSSTARTRLSEQFAEMYRTSQEDYRDLLNALRDNSVDLEAFARRTNELMEMLLKLKRLRIQLFEERDRLEKSVSDEASELS